MSTPAKNEPLPGLGQVAGKHIVVVGCGEGRIVRLLAEHGARAVGVERNPSRLTAAYAQRPAGDETYVEGRGEDLPFDDATSDVVLYFGTLHHVPVAHQRRAIAEAARALRPGGLAYISEPLAGGPYFELLQPVDDETEVRARALEAIRDAGAAGFAHERELIHNRVMSFKDFAAFRSLVLTIGPERERDFARNEPELQRRFAHLGRVAGGSHEFDQPFRVNLLRKAGGGTGRDEGA